VVGEGKGLVFIFVQFTEARVNSEGDKTNFPALTAKIQVLLLSLLADFNIS